jgi:hypothetical protein
LRGSLRAADMRGSQEKGVNNAFARCDRVVRCPRNETFASSPTSAAGFDGLYRCQSPRSEESRHTARIHYWLKSHGRVLSRELSRDARKTLRTQLARIERFLRTKRPRSRSIIVLASPHLWDSIPLQVDVTSCIAVSRRFSSDLGARRASATVRDIVIAPLLGLAPRLAAFASVKKAALSGQAHMNQTEVGNVRPSRPGHMDDT